MTEYNKLTQEELSDEELDSTVGGKGSYVVGEANGTRITAYCEHPNTTDETIKQCRTRGGACSYGAAEGARSCFSCRYLRNAATSV